MSLQSWVLFDESNPLTPRSDRLPESHATRRGTIHTAWTQLKHGPGAGVDLLDITGTNTGFTIVPTRGMGIWRAKDAQHDYGWDSPVHGPVHPDRVPVTDPSGLGWLEGFDELLVRCGLSSNGAPEFDAQNKLVWPLHGRIANIPARRVTVTLNSDEGWIEVEGEVRESKLFFANLVLTSRMRFYADGHRLEIRDEVMNAGAQTAIHQLLYHINFGSPVLESGAKLLVAAEKVVPRNARAVEGIDTWSTYLGPTTGYAEQVYFFKPRQDVNGWSKAAVVNAAGSLGVGVEFSTETLPWFIQWKNTAAQADGYVTGIEPSTNFPNGRSFEEKHGRVVRLAAGESIEHRLNLCLLHSPTLVEQFRKDIAAYGGAPTVERQPLPEWCS